MIYLNYQFDPVSIKYKIIFYIKDEYVEIEVNNDIKHIQFNHFMEQVKKQLEDKVKVTEDLIRLIPKASYNAFTDILRDNLLANLIN